MFTLLNVVHTIKGTIMVVIKSALGVAVRSAGS